MTDSIYFTGQAYGAYSGKAGGYATGLIGAGLEFPLRSNGCLRFNVEFTAGVVGGGGINVGSGTIVQPTVGLTCRLNNNFAAKIEASRVKALNGELDSSAFGASLMYEFSRPESLY